MDRDEAELNRFVALEIAMGLCRKSSLKFYCDECWLTQTRNFVNMMAKDISTSCWSHFCNSMTISGTKGEQNYDPLYKIHPLINTVSDTSASNINLFINCHLHGRRAIQISRGLLSARSGQVWKQTPEQRVAASPLRRYSFVLRLAIAQADARPVMPASFR